MNFIRNFTYLHCLRNYYKLSILRSFATKTCISPAKTLEISSFDELNLLIEKSESPLILDFYADWCPNCKQLNPIIEEKLSKDGKIKLLRINIDKNSEIAEKFSITGIPHIFLYKNGKKVDDFV